MRRGVDHPSTSRAEVKERVKLYLYSSSQPPDLLEGEIDLYLTLLRKPAF
jgi:hypothetical protein